MRTLIAFIALSATVGCYSAEFDAAAGSVFTCEASEDCDTNSSCLRGICTNDEGPSVNIVGPEENSVFAAGDAVVFPLTLSGPTSSSTSQTGSPWRARATCSSRSTALRYPAASSVVSSVGPCPSS